MARSPTGQRKHDRAMEAEEEADRLERERVRQERDAGEREWDLDEDGFHNYGPPRRLIFLELVAIILLIILLLFEPTGFSAISVKGTDTVGLLSSCSGGTCTSWLGAPAGGSGGASPAPSPEKRAPAESTSTSSPTTFHLQTGLAAFCSFILLLYATMFHLIRLRPPPQREGPDPKLAKRIISSRLRRNLRYKWDTSGFKRFGYRVSRLFTGANVVLLLCVCISAGVQASSAGFNTGFVLLVIAWVLLLLVTLLEFMDEKRKIREWLMVKKGFRPSCCGGRGKEEKTTIEDLERGERQEMTERGARRSGNGR